LTRRDLIRNRLSAYLLEVQCCAVVCPPKETVLAIPVVGHLYGWFPPMPIDGDNNLPLVSFCPELMAEITAWLDDEQLDTYLWTIEVLFDGYLDAMAEGHDPAAMREKIESELFDLHPESLTLLSQIELRALDSGVVHAV
jgi:hypothetical protein